MFPPPVQIKHLVGFAALPASSSSLPLANTVYVSVFVSKHVQPCSHRQCKSSILWVLPRCLHKRNLFRLLIQSTSACLFQNMFSHVPTASANQASCGFCRAGRQEVPFMSCL